MSTRTVTLLAALGAALAHGTRASAQGTTPLIARTVNRAQTTVQEQGRTIMRLDAKPGDGFAVVQSGPLAEGTLEADVRGEDVPQRSFVGLTFAIQNDSMYEAVYLRPFNFRTPDTARAKRAVQYVSQPTWPWQRLRTESPGKYEGPVRPIPDPTTWVHLRLVITKTRVSVYANDGDEPELVVTRLGDAKPGQVGLWVGNNSRGDFRNVKITPTAASGR